MVKQFPVYLHAFGFGRETFSLKSTNVTKTRGQKINVLTPAKRDHLMGWRDFFLCASHWSFGKVLNSRCADPEP